VFRWRWSLAAGESSIRAFADRWEVVDDIASFGGVRKFLNLHQAHVDPVRASLQDPRTSQSVMQEGDLRQSLTGLMELAHLKGYKRDDLERMEGTYWEALRLSDGGYRPCGRPFINHLVGAASVLVHYGFEVRLVQAALMHAAYTHAPHFDGGPQKTVDIVANRLGGLGSGLERAVRAYTLRSRRWQHLSQLPNWQDVATMSDIDTAILALANDIDMNLSGEARMSGRSSDSPALSKADDICRMLGVPGMAGSARSQSVGADPARVPRKINPSGSFRIEAGKFVGMYNQAFFQTLNPKSLPPGGPRRFQVRGMVRACLRSLSRGALG